MLTLGPLVTVENTSLSRNNRQILLRARILFLRRALSLLLLRFLFQSFSWLSPSRPCAAVCARRASSRNIGHCTRRRFSRAVSRVDARGMQPKMTDVHREQPKWATSVAALAAATVISGSMHSHTQALCMHDSARMTQPARRTRNTTLTRLHVGASHLRADTENMSPPVFANFYRIIDLADLLASSYSNTLLFIK